MVIFCCFEIVFDVDYVFDLYILVLYFSFGPCGTVLYLYGPLYIIYSGFILLSYSSSPLARDELFSPSVSCMLLFHIISSWITS